MILFDEFITLRAIEECDAEVLKTLINDPETESSVVGFSAPVSLHQQKKWIANLPDDSFRYAIDADRNCVGVISLSSVDWKNRSANINIKLISDARGKGIAYRASKLLISYCFEELNFHCITANVLDNNNSSRKLWEKLGFTLDGILRQRVYKNGEYRNLLAFSLMKDEFND